LISIFLDVLEVYSHVYRPLVSLYYHRCDEVYHGQNFLPSHRLLLLLVYSRLILEQDDDR